MGIHRRLSLPCKRIRAGSRGAAVSAAQPQTTGVKAMTTNIKNVTVLGTGVLGSQIAYQTAYSGFDVTAYDISDEIVKAARKRFEELAERYEREIEGASGDRARAALERIKYSSSLADAVREADLVIESVPEILDVKRKLYQKLAPLAPERA